MDRWRKFRQLSWAARGYLLEALLVLPVILLALRLFGFRRCQAVLNSLAPRRMDVPEGDAAATVEKARLVARMVRAAGVYGPCHATCLPESLALWWMLRRRRIPAELRIGVRKDAERFEAHAWVDLAGTVLNDTDDVHQRFAAFDRSGSPAQAELP
jgi:hypothetical protein